jgi:3-isopropylmalate/(R)-2-methylmalate dehydratase small subunit
MQPFIKHTGLAALPDRVNVDTDQMVPKQFLKALTREGFARTLFYDWRYLDDGKKAQPRIHPFGKGGRLTTDREERQ